MVGDSFTFCYGVEERDSYPRVLERQLAGVRTGYALLSVEVMLHPIHAKDDDARTVGHTGVPRIVRSKFYAKKMSGTVHCATDFAGPSLICTVLFPVLLGG